MRQRSDHHLARPKVNWFLREGHPLKDAYARLRVILLDCGLTEDLKWGCPWLTTNKKNVVVIHGFKD